MTQADSQSQTSHIARIETDRDLCISAGSCAALAPKTFGLDDEGKVKMLDPKGDTDELIMEAARSCPVDAIRLFDDADKQVWPKQKHD